MLRITIETTGGDIAVTPSPQAEGSQGAAATIPAESRQSIPADLAARAAAIGASSAGPAPESSPSVVGAPGFQPGAAGASPTEAEQALGGASALSAGAAPV